MRSNPSCDGVELTEKKALGQQQGPGIEAISSAPMLIRELPARSTWLMAHSAAVRASTSLRRSSEVSASSHLGVPKNGKCDSGVVLGFTVSQAPQIKRDEDVTS